MRAGSAAIGAVTAVIVVVSGTAVATNLTQPPVTAANRGDVSQPSYAD